MEVRSDLTHVSGLICRHKVDSNGSTNELLMNCQGERKQNRSSSGRGRVRVGKAQTALARCVLPPDIGMNELRFILLSTKGAFMVLPPDFLSPPWHNMRQNNYVISPHTSWRRAKRAEIFKKASNVYASCVCAFKCSDVEKLPAKVFLLALQLRNRLCFATEKKLSSQLYLFGCLLMLAIARQIC